MRGSVKTSITANLFQGQVCFYQKTFCPVDTKFDKIIIRRRSSILFKNTSKLSFAKKAHLSQILHSDFFIQVITHVFNTFQDRLTMLYFHILVLSRQNNITHNWYIRDEHIKSLLIEGVCMFFIMSLNILSTISGLLIFVGVTSPP